MNPRRLTCHSHRLLQYGLFAACITLAAMRQSSAQMFSTINLVTDDPKDYPSRLTDPDLVNSWGLTYLGKGPFWVGDNGTGLSTIYKVDPKSNAVTKLGLVVTIPGDGSVTGTTSNATGFNSDIFLFVSEDGTVSGWRGALGTTAEVLATASPDNVYKGATQSIINGHSYLYAANFRAGKVDVYKGDALAPALTGNFTDPGLPSGFAPFNVQRIGDKIYVTYAMQDAAKKDEVDGPGLGYVTAFDLNGNFLGRVGSAGTLNGPWGLAIAPGNFGSFAGDLLVGNFGDGTINAFDTNTNTFVGQLLGHSGNPLSIDGLWALMPGNGGSAGSTHAIYFTSGPDGENHGLFGVLAPEAGSIAYLVAGLFPALALVRRIRR